MRPVALLALALSAVAHSEPSTPEQLLAHQGRQESLYHCAPKIAALLAQRKRAAQVAYGGTAPTDASSLFLDDPFAHDDGLLLSCGSVESAKIRNHTCVLSPEVTQGPYYHTAGHPIRQNIAEDQLGLLFLMDIALIDIATCEPIPDLLVDIWHANTTGHYAGHPDPSPELVWEGPAPTGLRKGLLTKFPRTEGEEGDETWLRGAWPTNKNGVAQFTSIFPGYYTGRATHVHTKVHTQWTPHENGTFTSGRLIHTGQLFVDDKLNGVIDKFAPYDTNPIKNKWGRTRNWEDSLQIYQESHRGGYGPTFEIIKLGGVIQQGLIGFITIGVDMSASYDRTTTQQAPGVPPHD